MNPPRLLLPLLLALAAPRGEAAADFAGEVQPLLETYCYQCHGNGKKKGGLALDGFKTPDALLNDQKTWGKVLENLRAFAGPVYPINPKRASVQASVSRPASSPDESP